MKHIHDCRKHFITSRFFLLIVAEIFVHLQELYDSRNTWHIKYSAEMEEDR
jgi:hypothetical protein